MLPWYEFLTIAWLTISVVEFLTLVAESYIQAKEIERRNPGMRMRFRFHPIAMIILILLGPIFSLVQLLGLVDKEIARNPARERV